MSCEVPCISYMALYVISLHILHSNSRMSTHWKLNVDEGKVVMGGEESKEKANEKKYETKECSQYYKQSDYIMNILNAAITYKDYWVVESVQSMQNNCVSEGKTSEKALETLDNRGRQRKLQERRTIKEKPLSCGEKVNFTSYDYLEGVSNRHQHPHVPEPEVALLFQQKVGRSTELDMDQLENDLRKAKKEKPDSAEVYTQIGNFWRIKGDTHKSIECFRKALTLSPDDADVRLNLARVLFNLQYLNDAVYLAQYAMEVQTFDSQSAWFQHFALGEILKVAGDYHDAALHFRLSLKLNPQFLPAVFHLRSLEFIPDWTVHFYTICIIVFLVLVVLYVIVLGSDEDANSLTTPSKNKRRHLISRMSPTSSASLRSLTIGVNMTARSMRFGKIQS